nr:hypothetical protein CFP56_46736 [Quercus suber]
MRRSSYRSSYNPRSHFHPPARKQDPSSKSVSTSKYGDCTVMRVDEIADCQMTCAVTSETARSEIRPYQAQRARLHVCSGTLKSAFHAGVVTEHECWAALEVPGRVARHRAWTHRVPCETWSSAESIKRSFCLRSHPTLATMRNLVVRLGWDDGRLALGCFQNIVDLDLPLPARRSPSGIPSERVRIAFETTFRVRWDW